MQIDRFRQLPLLGILRGIRVADVGPLVEAVTAAGLETIEITMNTEGAAELIRRMRDEAGGRLAVGAGTVLSVAQLQLALDAGATFIVMPTLVLDVLERCRGRGIPAFPGALTPQEILNAWRAGATMVKVFPVGTLGPAYLRALRGPFPDIELLACSGVTAENLAEYLTCGAAAAAFGASVFRTAWLAAGQYDRIGAEVRRLVQACRAALTARGGPPAR
jgi:2-dehydro-3-deoxyphosphogluconate aldolase/(4S)-4-hydroxy-2-oxoglutarate aldolase